MNPSIFKLTRLEFRRVEIEANTKFETFEEKPFFPQLDYSFNKVKFDFITDLVYPDEEVEDPRHFTVAAKLSILQSKQADEVTLPYSITIEGAAYLHFRGKEEVSERFKYIRNTGYMMLYSAFREYVANFTSRSMHGLWFLPTPNFTKRVQEDIPADIEKWKLTVKQEDSAIIESSDAKPSKRTKSKKPEIN